jgi:hypothetical protein
MANQEELPPHLVKRIEAGFLVVLEPPKLDLEAYISNYTGEGEIKQAPTRLITFYSICRADQV